MTKDDLMLVQQFMTDYLIDNYKPLRIRGIEYSDNANRINVASTFQISNTPYGNCIPFTFYNSIANDEQIPEYFGSVHNKIVFEIGYKFNDIDGSVCLWKSTVDNLEIARDVKQNKISIKLPEEYKKYVILPIATDDYKFGPYGVNKIMINTIKGELCIYFKKDIYRDDGNLRIELLLIDKRGD